jgi:hypothetical protein
MYSAGEVLIQWTKGSPIVFGNIVASVVKNIKAFWRSFVLEVDIGYLITGCISLAPDVMKILQHSNEVTEL